MSDTSNTPNMSPYDLPADAKLYVVGSNIFALFDVGGVNIAYTVPYMDPKQASPNLDLGTAQHVSTDQWAQLNAVEAGSSEELRGMGTQWGSYGDFFKSILGQVIGYANPAKDDASVLRVIAEFSGRPDMSAAELQNRLQATDWYKQHTQSELEWNGLSDAERAKRTEAVRAQMQQTLFQFAGDNAGGDDPRISNYIQDLASGKMGFGAWTEQVVKSQAAAAGNTPWARQIADEAKAKLQPGVDIENTAARVQDLARRWGVQWSNATYQDWGRKITTNETSEADVLQALKDQAQVLYPWKSPDVETVSAAAPWVETYKRVMEKDADIFNPKIQQALAAGAPVWDFEQGLKKAPEWLSTKNARDELTSVMSEAGRRMGFN